MDPLRQTARFAQPEAGLSAAGRGLLDRQSCPAAGGALAAAPADALGEGRSWQGDRLDPGHGIDRHGDAPGPRAGAEQPRPAGRPAAARAGVRGRGGDSPGGPGRSHRTDRQPRAGRVLLCPVWPVQQLPLDPGHAGQVGRRCAEPDRPAGARSGHEPSHRAAARAETDLALAHAGRNGHRRRGAGGHGHVLPRGRLLRTALPRPQQPRPVGQPEPAAKGTDRRHWRSQWHTGWHRHAEWHWLSQWRRSEGRDR